MPRRVRIEDYEDCVDMFNAALASPSGVCYQTTREHAIATRSRLHALRRKMKDDTREVWPIGDPRHNSTNWDDLTVRVIEANGQFFLEIAHKPKLIPVSGPGPKSPNLEIIKSDEPEKG